MTASLPVQLSLLVPIPLHVSSCRTHGCRCQGLLNDTQLQTCLVRLTLEGEHSTYANSNQ